MASPEVQAAGIGAAASAGGGLVSGLINRRSAKAARAWQKRRYAERYQVTVNDMKAAGLNPILAAQGALGQVGGMAGASPAQMPTLAGIGDTITNAKKQPSETDLKRAQRTQSAKQLDFIDSQILKEQSIVALNDSITAKNKQDLVIKKPASDLGGAITAGTGPLSDFVVSEAATSAKGISFLKAAISEALDGNTTKLQQIIQGKTHTNAKQLYRRDGTKRVGSSGGW